MRALLYSTEMEGDGKRLQTVVEKTIHENNLEVLRTIEDLESSLRTPLGDKAIAVLMASNMRELKNFLSLRNLMDNMSVVLIVPNYKPETLELAHLLLPRYMEYKGNEFYFLSQVLSYLAS